MYDKYVIKENDSWDKIALRFDTSVDMLKDINNHQNLRVGGEIIVPKLQEKYFEYYTIKKGDSLYQISKEYNINPELLAQMNGLNMDDYIYPNQELLIPKHGYSYYITSDGDTLDIVASSFGIDKGKLLDNNSTIYLLPNQLLINKIK